MRILRVAQNLYPDVTGGGPYHVHALSRDQAALGHDVTVLTVGDATDTPTDLATDYEIVRQPASLTLFGNALSLGMARVLRRAGDYDLVHAHSHLYASTNLAALAAWHADVPLAITNHGLFSQSAPEWVFELYLRTLGRWTFNLADKVFCYTTTDERRVREYGVEAPVAVIPNGIDTDRFTPTGERDPRVEGAPAVLFVGRLVEGKRPTDAVATLARLRRHHPNAMLTFCGDGPRRTAVRRRAADLGVADAVTMVGDVPYPDMPSIYRAADVLLLPSRAEGLPRTVLEALASGIPVVASALPQLEGLVDGVGQLVPGGDIEGYAAAIETVLAGTPAQPREAVRGTYSWETTVRQTTAALAELVGETTSR